MYKSTFGSSFDIYIFLKRANVADNDMRVPQLRDIRVIDPDRRFQTSNGEDPGHQHPSTLHLVPETQAQSREPHWRCGCGTHGQYQVLSNILICSFAFLLNFTAFQSMQALQSSLNRSANVV